MSACCVAAPSYCHPGRHANVDTPCVFTPCLNRLNLLDSHVVSLDLVHLMPPILLPVLFSYARHAQCDIVATDVSEFQKSLGVHKFLSAKFGFPPPSKSAENEEKLYKSVENPQN